MRLIDAHSAAEYLRSIGRIGPYETVNVRPLTGGVSNEVFYIERGDPSLPDFVLKQARPQLRAADPWFCRVERIWREVETLRVCQNALASWTPSAPQSDTVEVTDQNGKIPSLVTAVPHLVFEDRENYAFAMTAAPPHEVWKQRLLAGRTEPAVAHACGQLLGALHAQTWRDNTLARDLGDRSFFDELRIDPYYRQIARVHPELKGPIDDLIDSLDHNCLCLVHGDFSPKNLLVHEAELGRSSFKKEPSGVTLLDFEVGHFGDPAFDLGFFLTHFALKAFWSGPRWGDYLFLTQVFWGAYRAATQSAVNSHEFAELTSRTVRNFAACMLARIDGKSKVEYLSKEALRQQVRCFARQLLLDPPCSWKEVINRWPT